MEESNIWIIGVVALAIGGLIGFLMGRSGGSSDEQEKLEDAKKELENYKTQVAGHFEETADLVNKMTESYRGVYQHLATGAQALCDADTARSIESSMTPQLIAQKEVEVDKTETTESETTDDADAKTISAVEPPRDYAPKQPDEEGTLSESYGLKEAPDDIGKADAEPSTEENTRKA
ncbi:YhcB family protein [Neptunomonas japonica]|uniref:Z-ring associated protein G n=1 Tax=Neptunomonas japonica JAMM 1380 TaxID=1441457 RepID=A0A7R6SWP3_9GAMM|nr:DUF1043 family protein [Neptunomonas japonica]BBB30700.1 cytochrome d ubiquinol oxidase subunit III [Neptunomonas japonica JAMM 1380]